jgi:hypothetical protein
MHFLALTGIPGLCIRSCQFGQQLTWTSGQEVVHSQFLNCQRRNASLQQNIGRKKIKHKMYHGQQNIHWMHQGLFPYELISISYDILGFRIGVSLKVLPNRMYLTYFNLQDYDALI